MSKVISYIDQTEHENLTKLFVYHSRKYKIKSDETVLNLKYNGINPVCKCGCGNKTKYSVLDQDFRTFLKGHQAKIKNNFVRKDIQEKSIATKRKKSADGLYKMSDEFKKRRSELMTGEGNSMYGKKHKDLAKEIISKKRILWNKENPEKVNLHMKKYWQTEEAREKQRNRRYEYFKTQQRVLSKFERIFFRKLLDEINLTYEHQYRLERKLYDFIINQTKILIEVDGDFWHCNPKFYPNGPKYEVQKENIKRDKIKNQLAEDNGYTLLRFWEDEIKTSPESVKEKILLTIDIYNKENKE